MTSAVSVKTCKQCFLVSDSPPLLYVIPLFPAILPSFSPAEGINSIRSASLPKQSCRQARLHPRTDFCIPPRPPTPPPQVLLTVQSSHCGLTGYSLMEMKLNLVPITLARGTSDVLVRGGEKTALCLLCITDAGTQISESCGCQLPRWVVSTFVPEPATAALRGLERSAILQR